MINIQYIDIWYNSRNSFYHFTLYFLYFVFFPKAILFLRRIKHRRRNLTRTDDMIKFMFFNFGPVVSRLLAGVKAPACHAGSCPASRRESSSGQVNRSFKIWSGSSIRLEHLPVTQEVASSILVRTARLLGMGSQKHGFPFYCPLYKPATGII